MKTQRKYLPNLAIQVRQLRFRLGDLTQAEMARKLRLSPMIYHVFETQYFVLEKYVGKISKFIAKHNG